METALWLSATLATAVCAGWLAKRAKVPTGAMVGAMVGVAILNVITGMCVFPVWLRQGMQVASGAMIGCRVDRSDLLLARRLALPALIMVPCLLAINLLLGLALMWVGGLDIATALFSCAPGGVTEMALVATDLGADIGIVSILQLIRLFGVISIFPPIFKHLRIGISAGEPEPPAQRQQKPGRADYLLTALVASAGGLLGWMVGLPAGAMVGAMLATAALSIATGRAAFPGPLRTPVQFTAGAYMGSRMTMDTLLALGSLALPALLIVGSLFVNTFGIGFLLYKLVGLDRRTCLLASTPGGIQEMSLLADDLGADATAVSMMQTIRLFSVILFFPSFLTLAIQFLG